MDKEFQAAYKRLNDAQRLAVDSIEGPLLVLAGPGTGKTELLSIRIGNILRHTDMAPGNILCLTFTESAQANMQGRLSKLIGPLASQVAVHTFHSFGSHIIGTHGDYFQEAFGFRPSDDVTRYQMLADILERLPRDIRLAGLYDGQYFYLKDIQSRISQLKQAGLSPNELRQQLAADQAWLKKAGAHLDTHLAGMARLSARHIASFSALAAALQTDPGSNVGTLPTLGSLCVAELTGALEAAGTSQTKPLTAWKNRWLAKTGDGRFIFAASRQLEKLTELADVYEAYQHQLAIRRLYDYDDMIMRVSQVLRSSADLRAELQEQYQYILVDEYQDTNGAQLRLLELLADNPVNEDQPNLMVVGDDDQAIYGFQGAYHSNILDFLTTWPAAETVVLTRNYRSTTPILKLARRVIIQGEDRLENRRTDISKELSASAETTADQPRLEVLPSEVEQFGWLADQVAATIKSGQDPRQIAIIAPKHKYLEALVPYLEDRQVAVAYERREDVLQQPHVIQLLSLARVLMQLASGQLDAANQLLPELLSYPWWDIPPGWLWELALESKKTHQLWLELMRTSQRPRLQVIAEWLLEQAGASHTTPLEPMMDRLMGLAEPGEHFASPYRQYYFGKGSLEDSVTYLRLLSGLVSLRTALRQYQPDTSLLLAEFVNFADLRRQANLSLRNDHPLILDTAAVQLLTGHKAKGLEFDQVFLLNVTEQTWQKERGRTSNIGLPPNYAIIAPAGDSPDEKLRLFYVALTRARQRLTLMSFATNSQGQPALPLGRLQTEMVQAALQTIPPAEHDKQSAEILVRQLGLDWLAPHFALRTQAPWKALLQSTMENYQLSPTHLTAFLDVSHGGPKTFLVNQLLRFPQALSVNAQFGNVMHSLMQRLHGYYNQHGALPKHETALQWLDQLIADYYFGPIEEPKAQRRGRISLQAIYEQLATSFEKDQLAEYSFAGEGVVLGGARLKGIIDCLAINRKARTAQIVDYKTGSALTQWAPRQADSYVAYKAHRYRQQILFYKLLVEHSRTFKGYQALSGSLAFVEPDQDGTLQQLSLDYSDQELDEFTRLIQIVYRRIVDLDFPDTSQYSPDSSGIAEFEADLLAGKFK